MHILISIHAPVKGATPVPDGPDMLLVISIHAPVKGATVDVAEDAHQGGISIHAPVKGATSLLSPKGSGLTFQSTLP